MQISVKQLIVLIGYTMVLGACLSGCGQKGNLYLPGQTPPPVNTDAPCRASDCTEKETSKSSPEKETSE